MPYPHKLPASTPHTLPPCPRPHPTLASDPARGHAASATRRICSPSRKGAKLSSAPCETPSTMTPSELGTSAPSNSGCLRTRGGRVSAHEGVGWGWGVGGGPAGASGAGPQPPTCRTPPARSTRPALNLVSWALPTVAAGYRRLAAREERRRRLSPACSPAPAPHAGTPLAPAPRRVCKRSLAAPIGGAPTSESERQNRESQVREITM
jgi:hypothetical protein